MKTMVRCLLVLVMQIVVAAPVYSAAPADSAASHDVVQFWVCEMEEGTTEDQVENIAEDWLKAVRQMPGGAAVKVSVYFPVVVSNTGQTDFYFVLTAPSFTDWGKLWDAYTDDSPAAKVEDLGHSKVSCPDSMLWETHDIQAN